jgi:hypothetical protein
VAERPQYSEPNYSAIDPVLKEWSGRHGLRLDEDYRGDVVRSVWYRNKVQIWFDPPDQEGYVKMYAAERRPDLPTQWGQSVRWRTPVAELERRVEELFEMAQGWL